MCDDDMKLHLALATIWVWKRNLSKDIFWYVQFCHKICLSSLDTSWVCQRPVSPRWKCDYPLRWSVAIRWTLLHEMQSSHKFKVLPQWGSFTTRGADFKTQDYLCPWTNNSLIHYALDLLKYIKMITSPLGSSAIGVMRAAQSGFLFFPKSGEIELFAIQHVCMFA